MRAAISVVRRWRKTRWLEGWRWRQVVSWAGCGGVIDALLLLLLESAPLQRVTSRPHLPHPLPHPLLHPPLLPLPLLALPPPPCPGLAEKVHGLVTEAVSRGARLLAGGVLVPSGERGGQFYPPTLLADVRPGMKIWEEEVFGPVSGGREGGRRGRGPGWRGGGEKGLRRVGRGSGVGMCRDGKWRRYGAEGRRLRGRARQSGLVGGGREWPAADSLPLPPQFPPADPRIANSGNSIPKQAKKHASPSLTSSSLLCNFDLPRSCL